MKFFSPTEGAPIAGGQNAIADNPSEVTTPWAAVRRGILGKTNVQSGFVTNLKQTPN